MTTVTATLTAETTPAEKARIHKPNDQCSIYDRQRERERNSYIYE